MARLTLDPDSLKVQTFETAAVAEPSREALPGAFISGLDPRCPSLHNTRCGCTPMD